MLISSSAWTRQHVDLPDSVAYNVLICGGKLDEKRVNASTDDVYPREVMPNNSAVISKFHSVCDGR